MVYKFLWSLWKLVYVELSSGVFIKFNNQIQFRFKSFMTLSVIQNVNSTRHNNNNIKIIIFQRQLY